MILHCLIDCHSVTLVIDSSMMDQWDKKERVWERETEIERERGIDFDAGSKVVDLMNHEIPGSL